MEYESERVAIVGAGAMGVMTAYHLRQANLAVDFLVRPARMAAMPASYKLYSYDDGQPHLLDNFGAFASPSALRDADYAFIVLTLDGAALSTEEGRKLLAGIGDAIRDKHTVLIVGSIGIGLRELAISSTGLPAERVLSGRLAQLSHRVLGVSLPLHPPTDPASLAACDFAFRHLNEGGFAVEDRNTAARQFAALFDRCKAAKCFIVPPPIFALQSRAIFPVFAASELFGWPDADGLAKGGELWTVAVEAVRQIQRLTEHGEDGKKAAAETTSETLVAMWKAMETASLPLDWQGFNAHQHGDKVKQADKLLLAGCIERGERDGQDMSAVREILQRWR